MQSKEFSRSGKVDTGVNQSTVLGDSTIIMNDYIDTDKIKISEDDFFIDETSSKISNSLPKSQKCWPLTKFFALYTYRDLKRHKCHFCLAFFTVFLIVLSTLVVISIIAKGPIIFLKLSE